MVISAPLHYMRDGEREVSPSSRLGQGRLVGIDDGLVVEAVQRHGALLREWYGARGVGLDGGSRVAPQARARYNRALRGSDGIGLIIEAY